MEVATIVDVSMCVCSVYAVGMCTVGVKVNADNTGISVKTASKIENSLIFLQPYSRAVQYHKILHSAGVCARAPGPRDILATTMCFNLESMRLNGELLGTLCGKRQDAALV